MSEADTHLSQINLGKNANWRVYNYEPATKFLWDINKAQAFGSGLQFPIQKFLTPTTGSFVVYLYANYNVDITGKTMTANAYWTPGTYSTRSTAFSGAYVRFEFQDVTSGPYSMNDYWWSSSQYELSGNTAVTFLDLNAASTGTLTASLTDRTLWTNLCGMSAADKTIYSGPDCLGGTYPAVSPYDGFTNAMKNVKLVGLGFGSAGSYASGVALDGSAGSFTLTQFAIAP